MSSVHEASQADPNIHYRRILLKLSGEILMGEQSFGINTERLNYFAKNIAAISKLGVQIGLVIGGGNIFRGFALEKSGINRVTGDHMGMLATVMNALAMKDALIAANVPAITMSAIDMQGIAPAYNRQKAIEYLQKNHVVIFAGGTGNPLFTTDTAACLRGIETEADIVMKATKVDGIYSDDPLLHPDAEKYTRISYDEALQKKLKVMDLTAMCLMREHNKPLRIFDINEKNILQRLIYGEDEGTLVYK
ncbi:MAG: UMP kinase [Endozoicomonadaceae bacterium]|nr:UMP kinase [Endozoicomonadaceae bacterium]MCY4330159.1 UMP kinase [Endozoicomonadaceae bacterium]